MTTVRWLFISSDRRVRSGWAIVVFFLAMTLVTVGLSLPLSRLLPTMPMGPPGSFDKPILIVDGVVRCLGPFIGTWLACLVVRQPLGDALLCDPRAGQRFGLGLGFGAAFISIVALVVVASGKLSFSLATAPAGDVLKSGAIQAAVLSPGSAGEELVLRGFFLQQLLRGFGRSRLGQGGALAITSLIFSVGHIGNPEVGAVALVNIVVVGVLFGVLTIRSGSLWIAIGLHIGWNFFQGFFWGSPISGVHSGLSVLERHPGADTVWTGGGFGFEASAVTMVLLFAATALAIVWKQYAVVPARAVPAAPQAAHHVQQAAVDAAPPGAMG